MLASLPDPPAPTPSRARRLEGALRQVVRLPAGPIDAALRGHAAMIVRSGFAVHRLALGPMGSTELLGQGDVVFGGTLDETASLPARTSIEAIQPVELTLLGPQLSDAIARDPVLGVSLLQAQQQRVDRARVLQAIAHIIRVDVRLLALLWHLADRWGRVTPDGVRLTLPLTHRVLGQLIGARRPSVTTAVGALESQEAIARLDDGWMLLGDPEEHLAQLVSESVRAVDSGALATSAAGTHAGARGHTGTRGPRITR